MAGKFGIVVNTTTEPSQLFGGDYKALKNVTIKAGEGAAIPRGTVLCLNKADGKYYILDLDTDVAAEIVAAANGALTSFAKQLAHGKLAPGTITLKATIAAAEVTVTDDKYGRFVNGAVLGFVDYESGRVEIDWAVAPDNATNVTVDYTYGGIGYKARAILASAEAVDATADLVAPAVLQGPVRLTDLVWPADITAGQKARAIEALIDAGVIVI